MVKLSKLNAAWMLGKFFNLPNCQIDNLVCYDPDEKPNHHTAPNAYQWTCGKRSGVITRTAMPRVTEFKNSSRGSIEQVILPWGGKVAEYDSKLKKTLFIDSPIEKEYSHIRFSQYGIG
jgi:hypothetical protein